MTKTIRVAWGATGLVAAPFLVTGLMRVLSFAPPLVSIVMPFLVLFALAVGLVVWRRPWLPFAVGLSVGLGLWSVALLALLISFSRAHGDWVG